MNRVSLYALIFCKTDAEYFAGLLPDSIEYTVACFNRFTVQAVLQFPFT